MAEAPSKGRKLCPPDPLAAVSVPLCLRLWSRPEPVGGEGRGDQRVWLGPHQAQAMPSDLGGRTALAPALTGTSR